jgi:hypothetical protein
MAKRKSYPRRYLDKLDISENLHIDYNISSSLGIEANERFSRKIEGSIFSHTYGNGDPVIIGKMEAIKVFAQSAIVHGYGAEGAFDKDDYLLDIGQAIYDFGSNMFNDKIMKGLDNDITGDDVLIINDLEILPKYRRLDISAFAIKDLHNLFSQNVGLMVVDIYPNQFSEKIPDDWTRRMMLDKFSQDFDTSFEKLQKLFTKIGFASLPGIARKLMFMCPELRNNNFDSINLD